MTKIAMMLSTVGLAAACVPHADAGETTRWANPVDGRWDEDRWTGGVPTRFVDVVIDATGGPYTITAPASGNIARAGSMLLDSDDATLIFDGDDNNASGFLSVHMRDLTLRRGAFFADQATFTPGTDVILDGADATFGRVSFGNNATLSGLAHTQSTSFDINFADLGFLQTDLGTTGNAFGEIGVGLSFSEETTTTLSVALTGQGEVHVRDGSGPDDSHLVIGENGSATGWSLRCVRVTNRGTIASDRFGPVVEINSDEFTNFGIIRAEGDGIEWERTLTNHGEIRAGLGADLVGRSLINNGSLRLDPNAYFRTTDDFSVVENSGDALILTNSELATARFDNSGTVEIQGGLLRAGFDNPNPTEPTFSNSGSMLIRTNGTLLAYDTRLSLLGDITTQTGGRVAFGSLDLEGETLTDFDRFGGTLVTGTNGTISNGAIDFGGRADTYLADNLGNFPGFPTGGPTATTFRDITLSNGTLGGALFTFAEGTVFENIDLDLSAGISAVGGNVSFDGRMFTTDGGPLELRIGGGTLTLEAGATIDAPYTEIEFSFFGGGLVNRSELAFSGNRDSEIVGPGSFTNEGLVSTSGVLRTRDASFTNSGTFRVLEGGLATISSADSFVNTGTIVVDANAAFHRIGNTDYDMRLSELGTVDRHRDSVIYLFGARLDLEGQTVSFNPSAGERGDAFHGLLMAREFFNGQLGVEDGGVRIGFGSSPTPSRIHDARLRGTVEIANDGQRAGNSTELDLSIGSDVDMIGATLLFDFVEADTNWFANFEGDSGTPIDADLRVEFTPGMNSAFRFVHFNRDGTLTVGVDRSITGTRFAFGPGTERVINNGLIAADDGSGAVVGRYRRFGSGFNNDFEFINNGLVVAANSALSVRGESFVNNGTVKVHDGGSMSLLSALDNRGSVEVSGEDSTVYFGAAPLSLGSFTLADGAAAIFSTDITIDHITGLTRTGESHVRIERTLDLIAGTLNLTNAGGHIELDGGEIRNGTIDLSAGIGLVRFADQGGFDRAHDPIREFLTYAHNALTDLRFTGGTAVLDTQVLLRGVEFVSNVENLGALAAVGGTTIGGDLTLADSSLLVITADASSEGFRFDRFDVAGLASLGGDLVLEFDILPGTDLTEFGGLYRFIDAGSFTGEFLDIQIRGIDQELISLAGDGAFRIVPAPASLGVVAATLITARRRRDHRGR